MIPLPTSFSQIPRYPLLYPTPSPIHPLPTLTRTLLQSPYTIPKTTLTTTNKNINTNINITLHLKREDHASPLTSSGNKYRKLEYLIPDILSPTPKYGSLAPGPDHGTLTSTTASPENQQKNNHKQNKEEVTLVTEGALQSNHTIQVTSIANHLNLPRPVIILHKVTGGGYAQVPDKSLFERTGNVQVAKLLGADVRVLDSATVSTSTSSTNQDQDEDQDEVHTLFTTLQSENKHPYWIPSGASLHPLGGLGYARCAFEIAYQETQPQLLSEAPKLGRIDYIFVACGSGSTHGGLIAGLKLLERHEQKDTSTAHRPPRKVIGVLTSPTRPRSYHENRVLQFARQAGRLIGIEDVEREITMEDVHIDERFAGTAYGEVDDQTGDMVRLMAREEAVLLDPVYTGKVARGMVHWVRAGEGGGEGDGVGVNVLMVHTGGQSALSAYVDVV
ncbi:tryptophan synthase beta subunit-like PLP-dependent enzyme [Aspergillus eucalypticola CBS 122712]|uniref:Tryptophan synthase beta subunit-like PLP-dependent enzyme n=1 Tax=Aspergillus eucalypticola (strain CBS 122712 / IBT 29274) TaxID=1448314 RepID=A0A317VS51_ASPEC|nr:tryptophan synthase beta subunit-like PLP-dependent enzyme [Aspergillus eucalypticola CBS 122712]PWY74730.1 tryptophan synthase beta subunit-like PLP-dependent enzyme [Aspergillus eucalypticola CBS 122712]